MKTQASFSSKDKSKQEFRRRLCRAWEGTCVSDIQLQQLELMSS